MLFCREYVETHPMKCFNSQLYDMNGMINEQMEKDKIFEMVAPYLVSDIDSKINKLYLALKYVAKTEEMKILTDRINFRNGTYYPEGRVFEGTEDICLNRLPVEYNPEAEEPKT